MCPDTFFFLIIMMLFLAKSILAVSLFKLPFQMILILSRIFVANCSLSVGTQIEGKKSFTFSVFLHSPVSL